MIEATNAETLGELLDERAAAAQQACADADAAVERAEQSLEGTTAVLLVFSGGEVLPQDDIETLGVLTDSSEAYANATKLARSAAQAVSAAADRVSRAVGDEQRRILLSGAAGEFYGNPAAPAGPGQADVKPPVRDRLKAADRVAVEPGERVLGSGWVADSEGVLAVAVGVDGPAGPHVRLGLGIYAEDKKSWRGANRGSTAVLDRTTVERVAGMVDDTVAKAKVAGAAFRALRKRLDATYDQVQRLEGLRFPDRGGENAGSDRMHLVRKIEDEKQNQARRRRDLDDEQAGLGADDRAALDALQKQIDVVPHDQRWPLRRAQQIIVTGLSPDEYAELEALDDVSEMAWKWIRIRAANCPPEEGEQLKTRRARVDELRAKSRPGTTGKWSVNRSYRHAYHLGEAEIVEMERKLAAMDADARPLSAGDAAALSDARATLKTLEAEFDRVAGYSCAVGVVPAGWGDVLVEAIMVEEGQGEVTYRMGVRPAGAAADWSPGDGGGEPFRPTPGVMRKVVALLRGLLP